MNLPSELIELVYKHYHAKRIQTKVRHYFFQFARHNRWPLLRRSLLSKIMGWELEVLWSEPAIRKEWHQEPESWVYMLESSNDIDVILSEVREGLWKLHI